MIKPFNVVIDGMDGVGKETQSKLLTRYYSEVLKQDVKLSSFPDYDTYTGKLVRDYLMSDRKPSTSLQQIKDDSLLYTMNRVQYFIESGYFTQEPKHDIHLFDRYTTANMIYQTLGLNDTECKEYLDWLSHIEYDMFKLPKPHVVLVLVSDPKTNESNMIKRGLDIDFFEKTEVQKRVYHNIMRLSNMQEWWSTVKVDNLDGTMKNPDEIKESMINIIESLRLVHQRTQ